MLGRARGCRGAGRPSRTSAPPRRARPTSRWPACSSTHAWEMFQSSCTSWSSKIITVGTVDSSQRMAGLAPALAVQPRVLLEVEHPLARRLVGVASRLDERGASPGTTSSAYTWSPSIRRRSGQRSRGSSRMRRASVSQGVDLPPALVLVLAQRVGRLVGRRHPAGAERHPRLALLRERAEPLAGNSEPASGHTRSPSRQHLVVVPGGRESGRARSRARSDARRSGRCARACPAPPPRTGSPSPPRARPPSPRRSGAAGLGRGRAHDDRTHAG